MPYNPFDPPGHLSPLHALQQLLLMSATRRAVQLAQAPQTGTPPAWRVPLSATGQATAAPPQSSRAGLLSTGMDSPTPPSSTSPRPSAQHTAEADAKRAHHLRTQIALANDAARRRKLNALPASAAESQKDKRNRTELAGIMARQRRRTAEPT